MLKLDAVHHLQSQSKAMACLAGAVDLILADGQRIRTRSVAYCTSAYVPIPHRLLPDALASHDASPSVSHDAELNLEQLRVQGTQLAVVGAGHSAAHLGLCAAGAGAAHVLLLVNEELHEEALPLEV